MCGVRGRQGVWLGHTCPSWPQGPAGSQYNFTEVAALKALPRAPVHLHLGQELPGPTWLHFVGLNSCHQTWQPGGSDKYPDLSRQEPLVQSPLVYPLPSWDPEGQSGVSRGWADTTRSLEE